MAKFNSNWIKYKLNLTEIKWNSIKIQIKIQQIPEEENVFLIAQLSPKTSQAKPKPSWLA